MKRPLYSSDSTDFVRIIGAIKHEMAGISEKNKEQESVKKRILNILEEVERKNKSGIDTKIDEKHSPPPNLSQLESNKDLLLHFENSQESNWAVNKDFEIIVANSNFKNSFQTAFGIALEIGDNIIESLPEPVSAEWLCRYKKVLDGNTLSYIDKYDIQGVIAYFETVLHPLEDDNKIVGVSCTSRDITSQKKFEHALIESENRYKTLVSNIPIVIYRCHFDSEWTMDFISNEIEIITGYPADDFIGNKVRSYASIIHSNDLDFVDNCVKNRLLLRESFELEYRLVHSDGSIIWVHERGRGHYDKNNEIIWIEGYIDNITLRKKTEEALQKSEEKYHHIFDSISDVYLQVNKEGIIQIISPSVRDVLGYEPEQLIDSDLSDILKFPVDKVLLLEKIIKRKHIREQELSFINAKQEEQIISLNAGILSEDKEIEGGFEGTFRDITMRKLAEQSLRERTNELNSIFDNVPLVLILVDEQGTILNVNKSSLHTGNANQQIFQKLTAEVLKCIFASQNAQGCGKGIICETCIIKHAFNATLSTGRGQHQIEAKIALDINKKTVVRDILLSTTFVQFENRNRVLLSLDDVTVMREAQSQVRKLSAAVEQSPVTIVITDINGTIQYANPQFTKTTGYTPDEAIGKNPRILRSPKNSDSLYKKLWSTILGGEIWHGEFLNVRKDGTEYWENAVISPLLDDEGKIVNFIAIKEDITERKLIQEKLIHSEMELRQMNDEKSKYFSILAHDLRGLLGSFYSFSDLLYSEVDNFDQGELKEQLHQLSRLSNDSLVLLDNLLEWAKASLGNLKLNLREVNLKKEVDQVVGYLSDMARSKGISLQNKIEAEFIMTSDTHVLRTIIRNLINNAVKFTNAGGKITILAEASGTDKIEISIKDTGVGIEKDLLKRLFKAGEKTVREGTNHEKGTGLGLMICSELVMRLGGTIHAESEIGKGSRFFFVLPLKQ